MFVKINFLCEEPAYLSDPLKGLYSVCQSSSDITQIRELQAELEEVKKQRQTLLEEVSQGTTHKLTDANGVAS